MELKERHARTVRMTGEEGLARLAGAKVIIIGNGGVGSYAAEAIARAGVGSITLMDGDVVVPSNLNRQLVALTSTIGMNKAEVMAERIRDIDPDKEVISLARFYRTDDDLDLSQYDWVVDAIDDVDAKTALIRNAVCNNVNIIRYLDVNNNNESNNNNYNNNIERKIYVEGISNKFNENNYSNHVSFDRLNINSKTT